MRVLLGVHQFLPDHAGGTEILAYNTAQELQRRGHAMHVVAADPAPAEAPTLHEETVAGLPVSRLRGLRPPRRLARGRVAAGFRSLAAAQNFREVAERFCPHVVHIFHLSYLTADCLEVCAGLGLPVVMTVTDFWLVCPIARLQLADGRRCNGPSRRAGNCLKHLTEFRAAALAPVTVPAVRAIPDAVYDSIAGIAALPGISVLPIAGSVVALMHRLAYIRNRAGVVARFLVPTEAMAAILCDLGYPADRIVLQTYGLVPPTPSEHRTDASGLRVGFIGSMAEHKGAHVLLETLALLPVELPVHFTLHGDLDQDPAYAKRLRRLAGHDTRVHFAGTFPNEEIGSVLSSLDLLVVPSLWMENSPLVLLSALSVGCPVVVSDQVGLTSQVVDGGNGVVFPPGDARRLASIIQEFVLDRSSLNKLRGSQPRPKTIGVYVDELLAHYAAVGANTEHHMFQTRP